MAPYDGFAWFYNRYWNEEFHSLAFPILERIWLSGVPAHAHVLDVCCGTGYLAGMLTERGYRVTGVDASPAMITHARENVPCAEFHVCDASRFHLPVQFAGAVSTFDSLNHLLSPEALESALRSTAAALLPGAPFVFDLLREEAYQTHWGRAFTIVRPDHVLVIGDTSYDFRTRIADCPITMFRLLDGAWQRADVNIQERCHTPEEVREALSRAGFSEVTLYDARNLGMAGLIGEGRTFYVAQTAKPAHQK